MSDPSRDQLYNRIEMLEKEVAFKDQLLQDARQGCGQLIATMVRVFMALGLRSESEWNEETVLRNIGAIYKVPGAMEQTQLPNVKR